MRTSTSPIVLLRYDREVDEYFEGLIVLSDKLKATNNLHYIREMERYVKKKLPRVQKSMHITMAERNRCGRPTLDGLIREAFIPYAIENSQGIMPFRKLDFKDIVRKYKTTNFCSGKEVNKFTDLTTDEFKEFLRAENSLKRRYNPRCGDCEEYHLTLFDSLQYIFPEREIEREMHMEKQNLEERLEKGSKKILGSKKNRLSKNERSELESQLVFLNNTLARYHQDRKINMIEISVKTDDSYYSKLADLSSHLDENVPTGKQISQVYSKAIKDIYRATVVVASEEHIYEFKEFLNSISGVNAPQIGVGSTFRHLTGDISLFETKNYWTKPRTRIIDGKEQTTFKAMKFYIDYHGIIIEVATTTEEEYDKYKADHPLYIKDKNERRRVHQKNGGRREELLEFIKMSYGVKK